MHMRNRTRQRGTSSKVSPKRQVFTIQHGVPSKNSTSNSTGNLLHVCATEACRSSWAPSEMLLAPLHTAISFTCWCGSPSLILYHDVKIDDVRKTCKSYVICLCVWPYFIFFPPHTQTLFVGNYISWSEYFFLFWYTACRLHVTLHCNASMSLQQIIRVWARQLYFETATLYMYISVD